MRRTPRPLFLTLAVLAAHATLTSAPARADLVVGIFSGTITTVREPTEPLRPYSALPDVVPAVGDPFSGVFGYFPNPSGYDGSNSPGPTIPGITVDVGGHPSRNENLDAYAAGFTEDHPFSPRQPPFFIETYNGSDVLFIGFDDLRRPFPTDGDIAGVWTEADFGTRTFLANDITSGLRYTGTIDRLTMQVAPEPAGLALMGGGGLALAGYGWRRRRRRRAA